MLAYALILLFTAAGLAALATLTASYARAFAAVGELRAALSDCEISMVATIRMVDHARTASPAPSGLRLVSSQSGPAKALLPNGLRAAA